MASSTTARFRLPVVKSWCDPRNASRIEPQKLVGGETKAISGEFIESCVFLREPVCVCKRSHGQRR